MSAVYEVSSGGEERGIGKSGTATRGGNGTARGNNCNNRMYCNSKYQSVALCVHTVVIVALVAVSIYLLQVPKTDVVDQRQHMTQESRTSEMIQLMNRLGQAETDMVALKNALATSESEMTSLKLAHNTTQSEMTTLKAAGNTTHYEMTSLKSEMAILNTTQAYQTPTVFFTAKRTDSTDTVHQQAIIFPTVQINTGGGYNRSSGVFTAPHSGLYFFTTNVCSWQHKYVCVHLVAAGTAIAGTFKFNGEHDATCTSISGVAVLREGDTARVMGMSNQTRAMYQGDFYKWPSFAGMLVHKT